MPVHKIKTWRVVTGVNDKGKKVRAVDPALLKLFSDYEIDINVMAFVSQFIPLDICNQVYTVQYVLYFY